MASADVSPELEAWLELRRQFDSFPVPSVSQLVACKKCRSAIDGSAESMQTHLDWHVQVGEG